MNPQVQLGLQHVQLLECLQDEIGQIVCKVIAVGSLTSKSDQLAKPCVSAMGTSSRLVIIGIVVLDAEALEKLLHLLSAQRPAFQVPFVERI